MRGNRAGPSRGPEPRAPLRTGCAPGAAMASVLLGWAGAALRGPFQGAPIAGVTELVEAAFGDAIEARRGAA